MAASDASIIAKCLAHGIDLHRLETCLSSRDNWGNMVHSFEYLTVLEAVRDAMKDASRVE